MKKRFAVSGQRLVGPLFVHGEHCTMFMSCKNCGEPLTSLRGRILGICANCLKNAGVEIGKLLVVPTPGENVQEN